MKNSIKTYTDAVVYDNKEYIIKNGGDVAEYLLANAENLEFGWFFYLSSEEILEYEDSNSNKIEEIRNEIKDFINDNYNYNINIQKIEFHELPAYLWQDAIDLANNHDEGTDNYSGEDISDDFIFEYDENNNEIISIIYRRFQDGGIAF